MHQYTSESVEALIEQFAQLPTVGRKTAQRLASYVLKMPRENVVELAKALVAVKDRVRHCAVCYNVTDQSPCAICRSAQRDHSVICVVEESSDVQAIERTGEYRGVYHVLGGVISPLDGVGPDDLRMRELAARIDPAFPMPEADAPSAPIGDGAATPAELQDEDGEAPDRVAEADAPYERVEVEEVILAVNPNVEGDTTAYYISQLLRSMDVRVTRIARGLPIGGDLEYADEATLSRALEGRGAV